MTVPSHPSTLVFRFSWKPSFNPRRAVPSSIDLQVHGTHHSGPTEGKASAFGTWTSACMRSKCLGHVSDFDAVLGAHGLSKGTSQAHGEVASIIVCSRGATVSLRKDTVSSRLRRLVRRRSGRIRYWWSLFVCLWNLRWRACDTVCDSFITDIGATQWKPLVNPCQRADHSKTERYKSKHEKIPKVARNVGAVPIQPTPISVDRVSQRASNL